MDDISSYIKYIIIAVILVVRFFISGKKKEQLSNKQTKSAKRMSPTKSTTSLSDILKELSGESATPVSETKGISSEVEDRQYDVKSEEGYRAEVKADSKKSNGLGRIKVEEEYGDVDFDLRQAIIAEVILTRPQY